MSNDYSNEEDYHGEGSGVAIGIALGFGMLAMVASVGYVGYKLFKDDIKTTLNQVLKPNFHSNFYGSSSSADFSQNHDMISYQEAAVQYTNQKNHSALTA